MIVTTMVGRRAQPKVKVPKFSSVTGCPIGAMMLAVRLSGLPGILGLTVPAIGTDGSGLLPPAMQESAARRGRVRGVSGVTVVVSVDVPLVIRRGRPVGPAVAIKSKVGPLLTGRSQPSVTATRTAANI